MQAIYEVAAEQGVPIKEVFLPWETEGRELAKEQLLQQLAPHVGVVMLDVYAAYSISLALLYCGLRPTPDFGLVCCDDYFHSGNIQWPELSRVSFDRFAMGRMAAEMMLKILDNPQGYHPSIEVQGEFIRGQL